jgi:hypothetical protein
VYVVEFDEGQDGVVVGVVAAGVRVGEEGVEGDESEGVDSDAGMDVGFDDDEGSVTDVPDELAGSEVAAPGDSSPYICR